jgi:hypothetical protein
VVARIASTALNGTVSDSATVEGILQTLPPAQRKRVCNQLAAEIRKAISGRVGPQQELSVALINLAGELTGSDGDLSQWR